MKYRIVLADSFYPVVMAVVKASSAEKAIARFKRLSGCQEEITACLVK